MKMDRIVGAFIFPDVWQHWTRDEAKRRLEELAGFGVNAIFTESETYRDDLIELAHERGLGWLFLRSRQQPPALAAASRALARRGIGPISPSDGVVRWSDSNLS